MNKIYYWSILTLIMIAFLPQAADAQNNRQHETHVPPAQALDVGYAFMRMGDGLRGNGATNGHVSKQTMQWVYTGQATDSLTGVATDCFYVFALQPKGFVIVAADNRVEPILGYSPNGAFSPDNIPENCRSWLQHYAEEIAYVRAQDIAGAASTALAWDALLSTDASSPALAPRSTTAVLPLLTTTWDQSPYYNNLCPGTGIDQAVTGCVATAMAQIIHFWEYPAHGFGAHQYTDPTYGLQSADFANTTYQYSLMPNELTANSSAAQVNAVATLMRHCGIAVNMEYDPDGSSAQDFAARTAFVSHFGYRANLVQKTYRTTDWYGWTTTHEVYTDAEWLAMIKNELDAGRPLYYSGSGSGGHAFVCDGYDADDLLHINWGWGGWCDGYFAVGNLNPSSNYFNDDNILIFVAPGNAVADTLLLNMDGSSTQTVPGSVLIGSTRALNNYECACNYTNSCQETLVLSPATANAQLLLEVLDWQNHTVEVYDGVGTNGTLLATINDNNIPPVMSSSDAFTLVYSGSLYCSGLTLRVSEVTCLPAAMNLTCTGTSYNTANFEWSVFQSENYPDYNYNWQIEYGPQGFTPGTGTTVPVTASPATIGGLLAETWYDAYLHYTCTSGQTNTAGPVTFKTSTVMECFDEPIVNGTNTTNSPVAFGIGGYSAGHYHCSQEIYTASELTAMGLQAGDDIVSLAVQYKSEINSAISRHISIFMGHTNKATFNGDGWNCSDWISWSSLSNVFTDKVVTISNVQPNQWEKFDFDSPFAWDGVSNVVIAFADSGDYHWSSIDFASNTYVTDSYGQNTGAIYLYQESTPISYAGTLPTGIQVSQRANMKLCLQTSCLKPTHLTYSTLNRHTVKLEWFPGYQESSWNVEYGPAGFTPGTGTTVAVNGNPTLTVSQLASGAYDFYVQAVCGAYDFSNKAKITITTGGFECAQIGEGTATNSIIPMGWYSGNNAKYTYTQQIYTAGELAQQGVTGAINSLAIQYNGTNQTKDPVSIYLGNTTQSSMNWDNGWVPVSQMQLVYNGSVNLVNGWTSITFDNPFLWDGNSNLVVAFLNNSGTENGSSEFYMHETNIEMAAEMTRSNAIDINNIENDVTRSYSRPNIRFCGTGGVCTLQRDMEISLFEGETYQFYGTTITEPGTYQHRWFVSEECDSLVVLHVSMVKIIFVTTTGAGSHDGSTWANAMGLQEAMDAAGTITDRVPYLYVKKGTYTGNQNSVNSFEIKPNVRAYGGFNGNEPANFDLNNRTQTNINQTILFGSNARRVLYQNTDFPDDQASVFDGFTIRGGTVNTAEEGGGAYLRKNCTLRNCVITANNAAISGSASNVSRGGVAVYNNGGTLTDCEIYNNTINISGTGYGHRVYGVGVYNRNGVVTNCNIHDNLTVFDGNGDNWQVLGGGIYDDLSESLIQDNHITHNSAERGGGLFLSGSSVVNRCVISNNTTFGNGGGVYTSSNGSSLNHCLISNNAAGDKGGGVYGRSSTFTSCNIVRNSAVNDGGGLYTINGGVLRNSIVWGNKVGTANNQLAANSYQHFTMESSAVEGGYSGAVMLEAENTGSGIGYPKFTNPTLEAGVDVNNAIGDWTLQNGSICIDMGLNALAGGTTDLAGNPRIQQERVDIGAYESAFGMAYPLHPQAESNIIYVTTTGAGTQDGSSWDNATSNLQYAMDVAMGCEPAAAVWVAHGTYYPGRTLIVQPKVAVYGGFGGYEDYTYDLALRDFTANATVIDGDSAHRVLEMSSPFPGEEEEEVDNTTEYYSEPVELLMPVSGTRDVTACSGTLYDDGGASGNYANSCDGTIILRSYNPSSVITLTGSYNTEYCCDKLQIYNGVGGDLIGNYRGEGNINITSAPNGILVLTFTSDGSFSGSGFNLLFTCTDCEPVIPETPEEAPVSPFPIGVSRFDGFVFQNGYGSNSASGAYLLDNTEMANCDFRNNHGDMGVYSINNTFNHCNFTENNGIGLKGENITANNCSASNNNHYGIYAINSTLADCSIHDNMHGLKIDGGKATGCTVTANGNPNATNTEFYGIDASGSVQIINTSVTNNHSMGLRANGGLYVNMNIANNESQKKYGYAAGVFAENNARFVNCNIVNNQAVVLADSSYWGDEIWYNSENAVGGVFNNSSNNEFTNCIIWGNRFLDSTNNVGNIRNESTFTYCAIEGGHAGVANITLDSLNNGLAPSASYVRFANPSAAAGITTQDNVSYQLSPGSACINVGNPNTTSLNLPLYDLAGSLRIKQNHIDIGAYEFGDVTYLTVNDTICLGESFFYEDYFVYPETPGLFRDTVIYNQTGVDYIAYINLTVNPVYNVSIDTTICEGQSYSFNGQTYNTTGTHTAYLQTALGCDSTVVLNLTVNPTVYNDISKTACESYTWNQTTYNATGNYIQTFTSATGCDSVVTLHLTINHASSSEYYQTACVSYTWNNVTYAESGIYQQTLTNAAGCDSVVTLHLTIVNVITNEFSVTACDHYTWNDITYALSGDKVQTFTAASGCDSVVTLHLTINQSNTGVENVSTCDSYTWINGVTYTQTPAVAPTCTLTNAAGCDSVVTLQLTIRHSNTYNFNAVACDSYSWNGQTYTSSGDYVQTLTNAAGCDSVVTLHLTIHSSVATDDYLTICENDLPYAYGDTLFEAGTLSGNYIFHLSTVHSCDSTATLHLTVIPAFTPEIIVNGTLSPCVTSSATLSVDGSYSGYHWSNNATTPTITVTEAGTYWVTATDAHGCTGVSGQVQLGLSELIDETPAICMVGVENDHNLVVWETLADPDVETYRIYRENSQANVYELLASVPAGSPNAYEDITADPSVRAYRYKITAADSCGGETPMSAYHKTVHLTINQGIGNSWNLIWTPYEGFEFSSYKLYRGTANNNLQLIQTMPSTLTSFTDNNPAGDALFYQIEVVMTESCVQQTRDVTYTGARSNIVYNQIPVTVEVAASACDSYDWNGQTLTASGDYTQTFSSTLGYDSVVMLHLTVNPSVSSEFTIITTDSCYTWNSQTYCASGDYAQTLQTVQGCDSVVTLHLTITVGIDDYDDFAFNLYPNPTNGMVNVQCTMNNVQVGAMEYHVFDAYGKLVAVVGTRCTSSLQTAQIDLSGFTAGVYFVKAVADGNVVAVRKVVKR
ncbi:MAG: C10 family peptidase [Bacteroidales bacterium]|nr:C10 family peptidase [Bacteroidales bacterium]